MPEGRKFTLAELRMYDGENGPIYLAHRGIVYDVTLSHRWRLGIHEGLHFPGQDLTGEITDAPHGDEVFRHPAIRIVGWLVLTNNNLEES